MKRGLRPLLRSERPSVLALALALVVASALPTTAAGQTPISISGQLDLMASESDDLGVNTAFRGDSPFNPLRMRLFARKWVTDRIGVFSEFLYDSGSGLRVNGAYAVFNEIGGESWFNARFGLAPNPVGAFGLRSTYFNANPLVGVPLVWQYRTNLSGGGTSTIASLTGPTDPGPGLPILYDSCWNIQWEFLGEFGLFEYSFALTPGSLSNPAKSQMVDGQSWMARLGATPTPGIRVGISASQGPYLSAPEPDDLGNLPYTAETSSFDQSLVGLDVEFLRGPFAVFAELHATHWQTPLVRDELEAVGGFIEVRYDVAPGWYAAGRIGSIDFGEVDTGSGVMAEWDQDVMRSEFAIGYRVSREVLLKANWQRTTTGNSGFSQNLLSTQLTTVF